MVMVRGRSGHGKSNFVLGLAYALGYCTIPATELMAWDWDGKWGVKLALSYGNTDLQIERGSRFALTDDGESITGSAASKAQKLTEAIGLETDLLGPLTYRPQRTFGLFLSMPDEDKKEFLSKLLGLDRFEKAADEAAKKLPDLERTLQDLDAQVQVTQRQIEYLEGQRQEYEEEGPAAKAAEDAKARYGRVREAHEQAKARVQEYVEETRRLATEAYEGILADVRDLEVKFATARRDRPPLPDVEVSAEEERLAGLIQKAGEVLKKLQADDRLKQREVENKRIEVVQRIGTTKAGLSSERMIRRQLEESEHKFAHATGQTSCPTCKQNWIGGPEKERYIEALKNDIAQHEHSLKSIESTKGVLARYEGELAVLPTFTPNPKIEQMLNAKSQAEQKLAAERASAGSARQELIANYSAEDANWRATVATARATAEQDRKGVEDRRCVDLRTAEAAVLPLAISLDEARTALQSAEVRLAGIQAQNRTHIQLEQQRTMALNQQRAALAAQQERRDEQAKLVGAERDFAVLVGRDGYLGSIFEEVLAEIAYESNEVLVRVPNVQNFVLEFKTKIEAKTTGKAKARITPVIRVNGTERPLSSLSGGQTSVVELATDIAIRRVVSRRRGVHIGWMVIDEGFDGLGKLDKEACLEVLQYAAKDDLILVVDHATEFRDHFNMFLDVTVEGGESRATSSW